MGIFKRLFAGVFPNVKIKVLLIGLDNSGKTTILNQMKPKKASLNTVPTVGFTEENFIKNGIQFSAVDMSGQGKYRNLWEQYFADTEAVIFVIDSTDRLRFAVAKEELFTMLEDAKLAERNIPILVFANKMDCVGAADPMECMQSLWLGQIQNKSWNIFASDALHNEGIEPGIKWLVDEIKKRRSDCAK